MIDLKNIYTTTNPYSSKINSIQIPDSMQIPVYGFVFVAGLVIGSIIIQSFIKK